MQIKSIAESSLGLSSVPSGEFVVGPVAGDSLAFSLVVPTFNESHNIHELVSLLKPAISSQVGDSYEIIIVDDDSPDETWKVAAALAVNDPHVVAVRRTQERGLATAVVRGWQIARGRSLGVIDADLQHPPEVMAKLVAALNNSADLAIGSRDVEGGGTSDWSVLRLLISRGSRAVGRILLPGVLGQVSDPMTGLFAFRRAVIEGVTLNPVGYKILVELLVRAKFNTIIEVGYVFRSRQRGESKASARVFFDYLQHLARLRTYAHSARRSQVNPKLRGAASIQK